MRQSLLVLAALPCLLAGAAEAADLAIVTRPVAVRPVEVTRVVSACPPITVKVARGRRGMGEPGTFYAYWDWRIPRACNFVFGR